MKNKGPILRKYEEWNKDMTLRMYKRKGNLSGNKQSIQVKMNGPTVLKLVLISVHSQLKTKQREHQIQNVVKEALKALRCTHV